MLLIWQWLHRPGNWNVYPLGVAVDILPFYFLEISDNMLGEQLKLVLNLLELLLDGRSDRSCLS